MAKDSDTGLPPGVEAAWGLRERPGKGPRPGLSVDRVVGAAVELAGAEGLQAVSMGRVASALGVSTMSLYRYVASKEELLVLMREAVYGSPPEGPDPGEEGWRAALAHWARSMREVLYRNLWVLHLPVTGPPTTPRALTWMERGLACLRGTGLEAGEKLQALLLIDGFVRNEARLASDIASAARTANTTPDEAMAAYARLLASLVDPRRFPEIGEVLAAGTMTEEGPEDTEFAFGLDRILDGVEALVEKKAGEKTASDP